MPKTSPGTSLLRGTSRPVRWSIWLAAGIVFGLVLGFAAGLAKPRIRK
jgi:hypothetical protein